FMRSLKLLTLICFGLMLCLSAQAGPRIKKVLPHFIDAKGRTSLSPSLYERDAYQFLMRTQPDKRSGLRFDVQWTGAKKNQSLSLQLELRGVNNNDIQTRRITVPVRKTGFFSTWSAAILSEADYRN